MYSPITLVVFPVKDMDKAKVFYTAFLGVDPNTDSPNYVGYKVGDLEIGLDHNGQEQVSYTDVADINQSLSELVAAGAEVHSEAKNVGGGLLIAQVKDADGNILGLRQQG